MSDWHVFVSGLAVPLLLYWLSTGVMDMMKTRRARKAAVSENMSKVYEDIEEERDYYRSRVNQLDDYAHCLRRQVMELGGVPKPWPEHRRTMDPARNGNTRGDG